MSATRAFFFRSTAAALRARRQPGAAQARGYPSQADHGGRAVLRRRRRRCRGALVTARSASGSSSRS